MHALVGEATKQTGRRRVGDAVYRQRNRRLAGLGGNAFGEVRPIDNHDVAADIWSATSFQLLREESRWTELVNAIACIMKAATPPGMTVTVKAVCVEVRGPRVRFKLTAHDDVDEIGAGTHERFIVSWDRFNRGIAAKLAKAQTKVDA